VLKKIEAVIREEALEDVLKALSNLGIKPITTYPVRGRGRQGGVIYHWKEGVERYELLPRIKIELVLPDHLVEKAVETIRGAVHEGVPGDGKLWVLPVEDAFRLRTGERGDQALL
jgi:nitrogen regulatory protein P-II 1